MALDENFLYQPRTMLEALKQRPAPKRYFLDTFFKTVKTFATVEVEMDIQKSKRRVAGFTNPVNSGKVVERDGFKTTSIRPAYIKEMTVIEVADLLSRQMGQNIYDPISPMQRAASLMGEDLAMLNERIVRREELMCAEALFTGKITIDTDGYRRVVDYGYVPGEHIKVLSGGSLWNSPTGDPMRDLDDMRMEIVQRSGVNPNRCIVGKDVYWAIINNPIVKERLDNRRLEMGTIKPEAHDGVRYLGTLLPSMLELYAYDEMYTDSDGVDKPLVPADAVLLGSTEAGCMMLYGLIQNLKNPAAVSRFPSVWENPDGGARWIQLESAPLPNIRQVDAFMVAHVVA